MHHLLKLWSRAYNRYSAFFELYQEATLSWRVCHFQPQIFIPQRNIPPNSSIHACEVPLLKSPAILDMGFRQKGDQCTEQHWAEGVSGKLCVELGDDSLGMLILFVPLSYILGYQQVLDFTTLHCLLSSVSTILINVVTWVHWNLQHPLEDCVWS